MGDGRESLMPAPNYYTSVQDLAYKDLLTSTFTQASHDRGKREYLRPAAARKNKVLQIGHQYHKSLQDHINFQEKQTHVGKIPLTKGLQECPNAPTGSFDAASNSFSSVSLTEALYRKIRSFLECTHTHTNTHANTHSSAQTHTHSHILFIHPFLNMRSGCRKLQAT